MQQPLSNGISSAPRFYVTGRQPLSPGAILLGVVVAVGALSSVLYGLQHTGRIRLISGGAGGPGSATATAASSSAGDDKDDPSQIDTIVLGDPADAPVPARKGDHVSPVHPFVVVRLPRFGDDVGLIPNTPGGHLLYDWLAAFNQASYAGLGDALPNLGGESAVDVQMELRQKTGGFSLLSAKEIAPGILVFRLRDQTPAAGEVLGTLQVQANSSPAAIATFSLRAVPSPRQGTAPSSAVSGR